jgi:hypothetical protein
VEVLTVLSVTANVAEVAPVATVAVVGTVTIAAGDALSVMVAPGLNAAEVSVTVQVAPSEGLSDAGLHETLLSAGAAGLAVRPNVTLDPE